MITSFFQVKKSSKKVKPEDDKKNKGPDCPSSSSATTKRKQYGDEDDEQHDRSEKRIKINDGSTSTSSSFKNPQIAELFALLDSHDDGEATKTWRDVMMKSFQSPSFEKLALFVSKESFPSNARLKMLRRQSKTIYPPIPDTFSALNYTPLDKVKVVIVGQDPYHGPGQGHGLAFSVRRGVQIPPSLRNIYKELMNDKDISNFRSLPQHGYLERWARQGVLMINTVLTVRRGEANSHKNKGWETVTDDIIRAIDRRAKANGTGVVFLLWGKPATKKATTVLGGTASTRHTIICTSHPSPLGATKTNSPFMGSKCFSKANQALKKIGMDEIDWRVDGAL